MVSTSVSHCDRLIYKTWCQLRGQDTHAVM